jgi:SpoVK/Ycf46/Vps4 family AAA+-type ATPase
VLAGALDEELLVVDLSRIVSKWIGETEKHLSAVFDAAEATRSVLFFDEADSLFGERTEVRDASDRYANLETAFLLTRLERFDGVAVLATNLRSHIDRAFSRRLEAVVEFGEPDMAQRRELWRCHLPATAPCGPDVDLDLLARLYDVVGGVIRNAAVTAGFAAAADGGRIELRHLVAAIHDEYRKAGRPFPGAPLEAR